jgi:hypothetical protein
LAEPTTSIDAPQTNPTVNAKAVMLNFMMPPWEKATG